MCAAHRCSRLGVRWGTRAKPGLEGIPACPSCYTISARREELGIPHIVFSSFIGRTSQDLKPQYSGLVGDRGFIPWPTGRGQLRFSHPLNGAVVSPEAIDTPWCLGSKTRSRSRKVYFPTIWVWQETNTHFAHRFPLHLGTSGCPWRALSHMFPFCPHLIHHNVAQKQQWPGQLLPSTGHRRPQVSLDSCRDMRMLLFLTRPAFVTQAP